MSEATPTYQQQAYDFVKEQILTMQYKPGQRLTDTTIANEMNISRTPVRDALRLLENEGFLISEARRGWKVYTLSLDDIQEIFDIKVAVEGVVARGAAECRDEDLRLALQSALQAMRHAAESNDIDNWLQADVELHTTLFTMAGNERARRIITNLNEQWHRVRIGFLTMRGRMTDSIDEHEAFIESILSGKGEEAERQMRNHLNNVREELVRLLVNMVLPFVEDGV
jgi:DNA-binding GntR family transcriptional regulator